MQKINKYFLEALKASLSGGTVNWTKADLSVEEFSQLYQISHIHNVLPMILEATYSCEVAQQMPPQFMMTFRRNVIQLIAQQTMKSMDAQSLSDHLRSNGIMPCVVKGILCRKLYPNPDARTSGDEDVFIPEEQFGMSHKILTDYGMTLVEPEQDIEATYEVPYAKPGSPLYIELHKHMFPPESEAYGDLNRFFDGIHYRTEKPHKGECGLIEEEINGTRFLTMNYTDHLLYLILHSFKHFLHSGFGIRQVCDINLYATAYGVDIDWEYILSCLQDVRAELFAASMFVIGEKYLTFDPEKACYPDCWKAIDVDETAMLDDLLASGVFGQSDMSRKHSSNITLNAVIANKRGEKASTGKVQAAIKAVCLPVDKMSDRFTYLKKMPFLLPVAWIQRVWIYKKETAGNQAGNNAADSIKIGNERVELMRQYGIIKTENSTDAKFVTKNRIECSIYWGLSKALKLFCRLQYYCLRILWYKRGLRKPGKLEVNEIRKNVTFIFKSFERQDQAKQLYYNIQKYYPGVRVIIADDSSRPLNLHGKSLTVIQLPFNSGLSYGLQKALDMVETPYVIRMDDDQLLTPGTKFGEQLAFLKKHPKVDLVGVLQYTAPRLHSLKVVAREFLGIPCEDILRKMLIPNLTVIDKNHIVVAKSSNVFIAKTEKVKMIGYDSNIRMLDHADFFFRALGKLVSVIDPTSYVYHFNNRFDKHYKIFRSDIQSDREYFSQRV